jgi:hypothetical protein
MDVFMQILLLTCFEKSRLHSLISDQIAAYAGPAWVVCTATHTAAIKRLIIEPRLAGAQASVAAGEATIVAGPFDLNGVSEPPRPA